MGLGYWTSLGHANLRSFVIQGLGSNSRLAYISLGEEPCMTDSGMDFQKLYGVVGKEDSLNGALKYPINPSLGPQED